MNTTTYYDILGIDYNATANDIKLAYKKQAQKWHPDRNKAAEATDRFQLVRKAYAVLMNVASRREYDAKLNAGVEAEEHLLDNEEFLEGLLNVVSDMYANNIADSNILAYCAQRGLAAADCLMVLDGVKKAHKRNEAEAKQETKFARPKTSAYKAEKPKGRNFMTKLFAYTFGGIAAMFVALGLFIAYKVLAPIVGFVLKVVGGIVSLVFSVMTLALVVDIAMLFIWPMINSNPDVIYRHFTWIRVVVGTIGAIIGELIGVDLKPALTWLLT